jgi:hypothetical protein
VVSASRSAITTFFFSRSALVALSPLFIYEERSLALVFSNLSYFSLAYFLFLYGYLSSTSSTFLSSSASFSFFSCSLVSSLYLYFRSRDLKFSILKVLSRSSSFLNYSQDFSVVILSTASSKYKAPEKISSANLDSCTIYGANLMALICSYTTHWGS